jgi:sulfite oxidase
MTSAPLPTSVTRRDLLARLAAVGAVLAVAGGSGRLWADDKLAEGLIVRTPMPYNAEPALAALIADWITPEPLFYVRNHGNTPEIDAAAFRLSVTGLVERELSLSLAELKALGEPVTTAATLTCAGNRRAEFAKTKAVGGVQWDAGAIGNARWTGLPLASLLKKAGVTGEAKHVWFEGLDACVHDGQTTPFGASIPLGRALAAEPAAALLAWQMNGAALTAKHGAPLRGIVPGYIGARSVKWLTKVVVSDRPSPNYFQAVAYKLLEREDQAAATEPIYDFALNSAICVPSPGAARASKLQVAGYALPPGAEGKLARVEVSADEGKSWTAMKLLDEERPACWRRWKGEVSPAADARRLLVRAADSAGRTQPRDMKWNLKGYLYSAWHEVPLT